MRKLTGRYQGTSQFSPAKAEDRAKVRRRRRKKRRAVLEALRPPFATGGIVPRKGLVHVHNDYVIPKGLVPA